MQNQRLSSSRPCRWSWQHLVPCLPSLSPMYRPALTRSDCFSRKRWEHRLWTTGMLEEVPHLGCIVICLDCHAAGERDRTVCHWKLVSRLWNGDERSVKDGPNKNDTWHVFEVFDSIKTQWDVTRVRGQTQRNTKIVQILWESKRVVKSVCEPFSFQ